MLSGSAVVGFIPTRDFARAKAFYGDVLGLRLEAEDGFALAFDSEGTTIRVVKVGDFAPFPFTLLGWRVTDIHRTVAAFEKGGVVFERFAGMKQDAHAIWRAPSGAQVAWFKDPDQNLLSVSQPG
jgi:catechol 2,3-dioxygenase-like lactoylglutathione lyase family enzyme